MPRTRVRPVSKQSLFAELSDLSDDALFLFARKHREKAAEFVSRAKADSGTGTAEKFERISASYRAAAADRRSKTAYAIFETRRDLRYLVPVSGKTLPGGSPYVPGSNRPYRKETTDGIHHGWDVLAPVGTPVRALADGMVVRTVSGFVWKDFEALVRPPKERDVRLTNLDIYRGNQVWLKTADGNVTFYSHLNDLAPGIEEGVAVEAWEILGTVGVTGVPDKSYNNPHLHFEIQRNPHDGTWSDPMSVMRWDWLGKGMPVSEIRRLVERKFVQ